jgi:hypothetical protein
MPRLTHVELQGEIEKVSFPPNLATMQRPGSYVFPRTAHIVLVKERLKFY